MQVIGWMSKQRKKTITLEWLKLKSLMKILILLFISLASNAMAQFENTVFNCVEEASKTPLEVVILDLSGQRLSRLPNDVLGYKNLQQLKLNETFIEQLPEGISELKRLKSIELNHSKEPNQKLTSIPKSIVALKELNSLGLIGLPNLDWERTVLQLASLPQLNNLALMKNSFKKLPKGIENIKSLRMIWLGGNTELDLEDVFDKLPFIEHVGFGGNQYISLPANISNAKNITNLWLANNKLTSVEPLKRLSQLKSLTLNGNMLQSVPSGLESLEIESLSLENNPDLQLQKIINALSKMSALRQLSLSNNQWESLPAEISKLEFLEVLVLRGNAIWPENQGFIRSKLPNTKILF